ncbi:MAG: ABC transporter permease [Eubacteriales bacterium]|nr:ABC transporter permease [Eubacteriales bacterium]
MTVFIYSLKRLLRNKLNLIMIMFLTPFFIGIIFSLGSFGKTNITVGLVDRDNTPLTEMLAQSLEETSPVFSLEEGDIRSALARGQADYILVIDSGFSQQLVAGKEPKLRSYSIQETNIASRVQIKVEGFLGAAMSLAAAAEGDQTAFYQGLAEYQRGKFILKSDTFQQNEKSVDAALAGMGMLAMLMMLLSSFTTINLIKDRVNRTFYRVMAAPVPLKSYMLQNTLCFFLVLLIQIAVMFLGVRYVFGLYLGPSVLNLYLVMAVFALLCVAMGVALSALARTVQQAGTIASLVITPMSMLSGLYWPRSLMPEILQIIGKYLPPTWLIAAVEKVMLGKPLASASMELAILLGFTAVFFLLGTWRRADIAK